MTLVDTRYGSIIFVVAIDDLRGLGWIDLHLLAAAALSKAKLWTTDRPLKRAAQDLWNRES